MYFVYILRTDKNTLYTGQTSDVEKRILKHQSGKGSKYVRAFKSFELIYVEKVATLSLALRREWEIKQLPRVKKLELVGLVAETRVG
ncbi:MAG: GIY-YIG nuclease family protein [Microgenomates group bacterium]